MRAPPAGRVLAAVLSLAMLPAAAAAQTRPAADAALDAVYERFRQAYRDADPEAVAALYAEDALYLQPGSDIVRGRAGIRDLFADFLGRFEPGAGPEIAFEIVDREIVGDRGWDVGYYRFGDRPPSGKFIVLWKRGDDGAWRLYADGFSDVRPPTDAP